jgi:hypothetical protein
LSLLSVACAQAGAGGDVLHGVFELTRHGARAPDETEYDTGFKVAPGEVTAQGMRQRYLLGKYNKQKYVK